MKITIVALFCFLYVFGMGYILFFGEDLIDRYGWKVGVPGGILYLVILAGVIHLAVQAGKKNNRRPTQTPRDLREK